MNRAECLAFLRRLFAGLPDGFSTRELAEMTGVSQRAIRYDLSQLSRPPKYVPLTYENGPCMFTPIQILIGRFRENNNRAEVPFCRLLRAFPETQQSFG